MTAAPHAPYRGRFAPSPTGPLHAGSLVAALASWLDARAHCGTWLVRIEDLDPPRAVAGAADAIVRTLDRMGLEADEPVAWQSARHPLYHDALAALRAAGAVYVCDCPRSRIDGAAERPGVYPGTCRARALTDAAGRAWRLRVPPGVVRFDDRAAGTEQQDVARAVGDFVVRRADGLWAYQLAVVVDDGAQGITDVVRGADLLDNTARQIVLQRALKLTAPRWLHVPVVLAADGRKLSKQNGARPLDLADPAVELRRAAAWLGLPAVDGARAPTLLEQWIPAWRARWATAPHGLP